MTACDNKTEQKEEPKTSEEVTTEENAGNTDTVETDETYETPYTFTATSPWFLETGIDYMDDLSDVLLERFNLTVEVIPVSNSDLTSKNRIWISSGDMPDVCYSGFSYPDYKQYVEQGLVRALPDDYDTKYPNLAKAISATAVDETLKERHDGKLYCTLKPIMFDPFIDPYGNHMTLYYRKDWAAELGLPVKDKFTIEEAMKMAEEFKASDLNNNGEGKSIGLAIEPANMIYFFLTPYDEGYGGFHKKDGEYVWGPAQPETAEGLKVLKKYYDEGTVYNEFYAIKARSEVEAMFNAGITGMLFEGGAFGNVKRLFNAYGEETGTDPYEAIGMANIVGPDGKIHTYQFCNMQSINYFSPNMEDEKFERILALMDYIATTEAQNYIHMGFEGKDYTVNGDEIEITRDKKEDGTFVAIADLYPSYYLWGMFVIAWDDFTVRDPSTDPGLLEDIKNLWIDRTNEGSMLLVDYDLLLFSGDNYNKAASLNGTLHNAYTEIIVKDSDIETALNEFVSQNSGLVEDALNELNTNLVK
jgi:putative aldouronate transport system substrate-binding protein